MEDQVRRATVARSRCGILLAEIERERGPGIEATNVRAATPEAEPHALSIRKAARLLPAKWVRRANIVPGITVNAGGASQPGSPAADYNPASKTVTVYAGAPEAAAFHGYLHFVQEMHPSVDSLFFAFRHRYGRPFAFWDYADREYGDHGPRNIGSPLGVMALMAGGRESGRPLELFPTAIQSALMDWPSGSLNTMIARDPELYRFVVGVLLGSAER